MAAGEEILAMKKEIREVPPVKRTTCPNDEWPLEKHSNGTLHCPFCGWTDRMGAKK